MPLRIDLKKGSVSFEAVKSIFSMQSLEITAQVFSRKADAYLDEGKTKFTITLEPKRKGLDRAQLTAMAGEFQNELLNQEYRGMVGRHNRKISSLIITQALYSARGGENPAPAPKESEAFKKEVDALMQETRAEIERTMPKRIAPQGTPIPSEIHA